MNEILALTIVVGWEKNPKPKNKQIQTVFSKLNKILTGTTGHSCLSCQGLDVELYIRKYFSRILVKFRMQKLKATVQAMSTRLFVHFST